jgi:hypothetical protein
MRETIDRFEFAPETQLSVDKPIVVYPLDDNQTGHKANHKTDNNCNDNSFPLGQWQGYPRPIYPGTIESDCTIVRGAARPNKDDDLLGMKFFLASINLCQPCPLLPMSPVD